MIHRGEIVENIVRKSGYSLTKLAERLDISRNTLYSRFANANLGSRFIVEIGNIIHYDFTAFFPEIKQGSYGTYREEKAMDITSLQSKYYILLEKYNKMLEMVIQVVHENGLYSTYQAVTRLVQEDM